MKFFYPLRNKHAFEILDEHKKGRQIEQSTVARRASYVCGPLLASAKKMISVGRG